MSEAARSGASNVHRRSDDEEYRCLTIGLVRRKKAEVTLRVRAFQVL